MFLNFASIDLNLESSVLLIVIVAVLAVLAFELVMFIHALLNKYISDKRKLLWLIGMILLHPFVAIAYLFTDYRTSDKNWKLKLK
jgi:uncharacterized membrane protein YoaK (UPF0700 family)